LNTDDSDRLAHTLLVNCGRALAQAVDEQDLLQSVCNTLISDCGFRLAWFGYTEADNSKDILVVAQAGDQDGFLKETGCSEIPATMAVESSETSWIKVIADSPLVVSIRAAALKRGYTSVVSLPLKFDGKVFGALTIYADDPGKLDEAIVERLREWSDLFSLRVKTLRSYEERDGSDTLNKDLQNITARQRLENEAQTPQAEEELRAIIDNAPVFLWSDLPDGYCDFLNQPWLTYFNLSLQEAQGAGWATLLHPDDAAHHLESWQKSVSTGIPFETEARYRRSDGEYRWFLNRANPLRDKTGRIVKWYGTNIDIENLKRTEGRLRQSEAYLAEAQRLSHTGTFGWIVSGGDVIWSEETFRIFEYDRAIKPTIELVLQRAHPDDTALVRQMIDRVSQGRKPFDFEHRLLMPNGSVKYVRVVGHPSIKDKSGNVEFMGAITDMTERKQSEEALEKAQAELAHVTRVATVGELTASIAHEVNQPLAAIVNNASACLSWLKANNMEEARASAEMIRADGHRAGEIIGRIRALVKKAPPQKDWLDVNQTIREVIPLAQSEVQRNGVALETQLSDDVPLVFADRIQLQQVMLNLMMNAIEAMIQVTTPRELLISSGADDSKGVVVVVRDSGPGLDSKSLDRLFEPFYTTKPQGMGMGLAICRSIIEAHGGKLWAIANEDRGATFQFTLPTGGVRTATVASPK
jgi:PAS domain S-box-containing protein